MKKKLTIIGLVFSILMLASGCANNNGSAEATTTAPTTETTTEAITEATTEAIDDGTTAETPDAPGAESETARLANVVMTAVEFPAMMPVEDDAMVTEFFGLTLENIEEYSINQQIISAVLAEVIVIKPAEGKEADVLAELDSRRTYLIDNAAFYPAQEESAAATKVGSAGGYVYLICHTEAAACEDALVAELFS